MPRRTKTRPLELPGILPVQGRIVIGDAMFCQRDVCAAIVAQEGDYLFFVKDNQPGLQADVAAGFGLEAAARSVAAAFPPPEQPPQPLAERMAQSTDKGHGRIEERTLRTTTILTPHEKWPRLGQGFELTRTWTIQGETTCEEPPALCPGRDAGRGQLPGSQGQCAASAGRGPQRGDSAVNPPQGQSGLTD
jgi:hypothetical protein